MLNRLVVLFACLTMTSSWTAAETNGIGHGIEMQIRNVIRSADVPYPYGACVSNIRGAAEVGAEVLRKGGNAVDAVSALILAINTLHPGVAGIGGGGFWVVYNASSNSFSSIDGREAAGTESHASMMAGRTFAQLRFSGISVGVPGTLRSIDKALKTFGTMPLSELIEPAIKLAEDGIEVSETLAVHLSLPQLVDASPAFKSLFFDENGRPLKVGTIVKQPKLAKAFRLIRNQGVEAFYSGPIAEAIIRAVNFTSPLSPVPLPGRITAADLANYEAKLRPVYSSTYQGRQIVVPPPPTSGGVAVLQTLKLMDSVTFPVGSDSLPGWSVGGANASHVYIEAMRLSSADRTKWIGDSDYLPSTVPSGDRFFGTNYINSRRPLISLTSRQGTIAAGSPSTSGPARRLLSEEEQGGTELPIRPEGETEGETTAFACADRYGNWVSATHTIEQIFGSTIMVPEYGFFLNNELTDFNTAPTFNAATGNPGANDIAPNKRPRSSIVPALVVDAVSGKPQFAVAASGGARIIEAVTQVIINYVAHIGSPSAAPWQLRQAIAAPRFGGIGNEGATSAINYENWITPPSSLDHLTRLGHRFVKNKQMAVVAFLAKADGLFIGGGETFRSGTNEGEIRGH